VIFDNTKSYFRTSIWAIEVAKQHPDLQVDAFDIETSQAPHKQWLPTNVGLGEFDALATELPSHVNGRYDVVHVRLSLCIIRNNEPQSVIKNLMMMLKPGGYIQWEAYDLLSGRIRTAVEGASSEKFHAAVHFLRTLGASTGDVRMNPR
jgi:hypothetical protein